MATSGRLGISPSQRWNGMAVAPPMRYVRSRVPPSERRAPSFTVQIGISQRSRRGVKDVTAWTRSRAEGGGGPVVWGARVFWRVWEGEASRRPEMRALRGALEVGAEAGGAA